MRSLCALEPVYARCWVVSGAMREAIERVISGLKEYASYSEGIRRNIWADNREYHDGKEDGLLIAIEQLEEVLSNADNPNQQHPPDAERT